MSVQPSRHKPDAAREARREQIVSAAVEVFAAKGYRAASVSDIVEKAGVARGTFYLYFESKENVFKAALDRFHELYQAMARKETARNYENPLSLRDRLRESIIEWLRFLLNPRELTKIIVRQAGAVDPAYEQKYLEIVRSTHKHTVKAIRFLQKIGIVRGDLDPQFLNAVFQGTTIQIVVTAINDDREPDLDRIADQWITLLRTGVLRGRRR